MAISYTLVQRKDMSKGALEDAKLYYAQAVSTRRVEFDDLCDEIAETCTLTSAYSGAYPFTFRGCNSPSIKV